MVDDKSSISTGFDRLSEYLPREARQCMNSLTMVDQMMAQYRMHRLQNINLELLITARDTAHHCLISLPRWEELSQTSQCGRIEYEVCRLTTTLYVHCVISPLLPGCRGVLLPIAELHELFSSMNAETMKDYQAEMLLWSAFVCGIAAFRTQRKGFFINVLRGIVLARHISSLEEALSVCRSFIWTDCACLQGASLLWEALGFRMDVTSWT